jgi:hypothetical protein
MEPIVFRFTPSEDDYREAIRAFQANDRKLWLVCTLSLFPLMTCFGISVLSGLASG